MLQASGRAVDAPPPPGLLVRVVSADPDPQERHTCTESCFPGMFVGDQALLLFLSVYAHSGGFTWIDPEKIHLPIV